MTASVVAVNGNVCTLFPKPTRHGPTATRCSLNRHVMLATPVPSGSIAHTSCCRADWRRKQSRCRPLTTQGAPSFVATKTLRRLEGRHASSTLSTRELRKSADQTSTDRRSKTNGRTSSRACSMSRFSTACRSISRKVSGSIGTFEV